MAVSDLKTHSYDVVVIGAGGAGLRAAIEASAQKAKVALVCKSLLGKAHTVMAEGGAAAALGNVMGEDNWRVHFRDTMRASTSSKRGARSSTAPQTARSTSVPSAGTPTAVWRTSATAPVSK